MIDLIGCFGEGNSDSLGHCHAGLDRRAWQEQCKFFSAVTTEKVVLGAEAPLCAVGKGAQDLVG